MKKIEIKVYSFNELSEKVQEKVIQKLADINVDFDWWENVYEDAKNIGLKITSFDLDRNRHATGEFILSASEVAQNILNEHGETCETWQTANNFIEEFNPKFADYWQTEENEGELLELEDEFLNSLLEDYSIILQKEYEYLISEESIKETIEANKFQFLENGTQF
jgi:hypothetical protein